LSSTPTYYSKIFIKNEAGNSMGTIAANNSDLSKINKEGERCV
jgi:hypothetical protein